MLSGAVVAGCGASDRPGPLVDDAAAADSVLDAARADARAADGDAPEARVRRMLDLGLLREAEAVLDGIDSPGPEARLARAELEMRRHRYRRAEQAVDGVLEDAPEHRRALLLRARLDVKAWRLEAAESAARRLLERDARDDAAAVLRARIHLLRKAFDEARDWAERAVRWNSDNADAHALLADLRFWDRDPAGAEPHLVEALEADPFHADARFLYGYAIWRRVEAEQLDAMAAQWNLALDLDPLHYLTHWHFGNGHTNLTYADYAHPTDSIVRSRLEEANRLLARDRVDEAIARAREVERAYPESVLPAMLRGSAFYTAPGMDRSTRLDSAQATFRRILDRKPNYGPAHNGLAAVVKKRQFAFLSSFDSLEAAIAQTPVPDDSAFYSVFSDVRDYPGDRVPRMVRRQLGGSAAYLPLLDRLGREFTIPPLHKDLAQAMDRPGLRSATTFDNRQWMDIRGVGSGATGIEYVERGAHWERNVLAHEYAHLYHGRVLTDAESRRIRALYHAAMDEGRVLDYYAANNESEYFAQGYEAYLSPEKVHPLNHKSMNTRADLQRKDPALYAFIDSLAARQRAALAGDPDPLASNWAEVYVRLARRAREGDLESLEDAPESRRLRAARGHLDRALAYDSTYLPAYLGRAVQRREAERFADAAAWLERAEQIDSAYAPIYAERARLVGARERADGIDADRALDRRAELYRHALDLEDDLAERARLNRALRTLFAANARMPDAIEAARAYAEDAPTVSTYLRDRRDEAAAFAHHLRATLGYADEATEFFASLVSKKPQNYEFRRHYADALLAAGRPDDARDVLSEGHRILQAAGRPRADYLVRLARIRLEAGDTAAARERLAPVRSGAVEDGGDPLRLIRILIDLGAPDEAEDRLADLEEATTPRERARRAYTRGRLAERSDDAATAESEYRTALERNPYHLRARVRLVRLLEADGRSDAAAELVSAAERLPLPLGPAFERATTANMEIAAR